VALCRSAAIWTRQNIYKNMPNFPPILKELWGAAQMIVEKVSAVVVKIVLLAWQAIYWLFERFVDLIHLIAGKL